MKKKMIIVAECLIACLLYCIIVFLVFDEKNQVFWMGFLFTIIAFITQLWVWLWNEMQETDKGGSVLGLSILVLTTGYLIIQVVLSVIFMLLSIPFIAGLVIELIVTGVAYMLILGSFSWKRSNEQKGQEIGRKRDYIRTLYHEVELGIMNTKEEDIKRELIELADEIKYSDPISNENSEELEKRLIMNVASIVEQIGSDNHEELILRIKNTRSLLKERNMYCGLEK